MIEADIHRWWYYWCVTDAFDRSVPHRLSPGGEAIPMDGWPTGVARSFATRMLDVLRLRSGTPPAEHVSIQRLRDQTVSAWVRLAHRVLRCNTFADLCALALNLESFGLAFRQAHAADRLMVFKFGRYVMETAMPISEGVLAQFVGFEPDNCEHPFVAHHSDRTVGPDHGVCLRCGAMRPRDSNLLPPMHAVEAYLGDEALPRVPSPAKAPISEMKTPTVPFPALSLPPAALDTYPVGRAPGEQEAFSAWLSLLRMEVR